MVNKLGIALKDGKRIQHRQKKWLLGKQMHKQKLLHFYLKILFVNFHYSLHTHMKYHL